MTAIWPRHYTTQVSRVGSRTRVAVVLEGPAGAPHLVERVSYPRGDRALIKTMARCDRYCAKMNERLALALAATLDQHDTPALS